MAKVWVLLFNFPCEPDATWPQAVGWEAVCYSNFSAGLLPEYGSQSQCCMIPSARGRQFSLES